MLIMALMRVVALRLVTGIPDNELKLAESTPSLPRPRPSPNLMRRRTDRAARSNQHTAASSVLEYASVRKQPTRGIS
jgi:hypothetical protein